MPSPPPSPAEPLPDVPGFEIPEEDPPPYQHPDSSPLANEDQETSSLPPESPNPEPESRKSSSRSSRASTRAVAAAVEDELENLSGGLFELLGMVVNRFVKFRSKTETTLWLVTEEESDDFGEAAARLALRHIPDELTEGDGGDLLIMGSVAL